LDLAPDVFPFAGELVRVIESEADWEGAAERVLHNFRPCHCWFPTEHYAAVSSWVEEHHLHGRLVYFRARIDERQPPREPHPDSLLRRLEVKRGGSLEAWVSRELSRRFDYACCDSLEQFRREPFAITRHGQIRGAGERHERMIAAALMTDPATYSGGPTRPRYTPLKADARP